MQTNPATTAQTDLAPEPLGFGQRLSGIYFEPRKTLQDIALRPTWLGMFVILSVLTMAAGYAVLYRMDRETYMRRALEMNPLASQIPEEQIEQLVSRPPSVFEKISPALAPINVIIVYAAVAALFLGILAVTSAGVTFRQSLAVTFWAYGAPGILALLLGMALMWVRDPTTLEINPVNNVASNLGLLTNAKEHPALHSVLSSIDLFSAWTIALLATGFAAASERRMSTAAAAAAVLALWAIWVLCKAGFAALVG
jgi:hypothetical protein